MTFPLVTLAAQVTTDGISAPTFADILTSLKTSFRLIYGDDAYLEADSQDGQFLALIAQGIHDCNNACIAVYNSFSPATAVGVGLSNVVRINHMERLEATKSQVNLTLTGVAGTIITDGQVADLEGNKWNLPPTVTIGVGGTIAVTATADQAGALQAPIGTVTKIMTPVAGWQTVTNPNAATPGEPVESDAALRIRQEQAPALSSYSILQGLAAAINAIPGVTYGTIYENDTNAVDGNGLPAHSIAVVVKGGDLNVIAETIFKKKGSGVATHGTTTVQVTDVSGALKDIKFFIPTEVALKVTVTLTAGVGYNTTIGDRIRMEVAAFINRLSIGEDLVVNRLYAPALLNGDADSETYKISSIQAGLFSGSVGTADVTMAFTEKAVCIFTNVTVVVL